MALLMKQLIEGYWYINDELADPRTNDFFLIGNPWGVIAVFAVYLYFTYNLGPELMENRKPYKIENIVRIYNVMQIIACSYLFYGALTTAWFVDYSLRCQPIDYSYKPRPMQVAKLTWMYFMLKVFDLLDTIFFVLRKKQNQVSFLHTYHHAGMVLGTWMTVKYFPGGQVVFLGTINSLVHVIMYTHYLISSFKITKPWWKKYVTQLQILQFGLILIHYLQLIWEDCYFPIWTLYVMIPQNLFMITMFLDFYYKAYIKKPKKQTEGSKDQSESCNGLKKDE